MTNELDIDALGACLRALDDGHGEALLHPPSEWGPWVNGGAWLTVEGTPVDILLRDTGKPGSRVVRAYRNLASGEAGEAYAALEAINTSQ